MQFLRILLISVLLNATFVCSLKGQSLFLSRLEGTTLVISKFDINSLSWNNIFKHEIDTNVYEIWKYDFGSFKYNSFRFDLRYKSNNHCSDRIYLSLDNYKFYISIKHCINLPPPILLEDKVLFCGDSLFSTFCLANFLEKPITINKIYLSYSDYDNFLIWEHNANIGEWEIHSFSNRYLFTDQDGNIITYVDDLVNNKVGQERIEDLSLLRFQYHNKIVNAHDLKEINEMIAKLDSNNRDILDYSRMGDTLLFIVRTETIYSILFSKDGIREMMFPDSIVIGADIRFIDQTDRRLICVYDTNRIILYSIDDNKLVRLVELPADKNYSSVYFK